MAIRYGGPDQPLALFFWPSLSLLRLSTFTGTRPDFKLDMHDVSVPEFEARDYLTKPLANPILLFALYLVAYLIGLTPAVPAHCGLAITVLVIVNVGFLANGLGRDR